MSIRKGMAFFSPNVECRPEGVSYNWHTIPESLKASLESLTSLTQEGSPLDVIIRERSDSRFITQQYIEEVLVNLRYDGYQPDYESIRAVVLGDRPCMSAPEKLAVNYHRLMQQFDELSEKVIDPDLLLWFFQKLTEGISEDEFFSASSSPVLTPVGADSNAEVVLEIISAIANDCMTEPAQSPLMVSMLVSCRFWRCLPFSRCNNLMSSILSRFYLYKKGYRAFCYLPKTSIVDGWKRMGKTTAQPNTISTNRSSYGKTIPTGPRTTIRS